jgi:predicted ribosome quality control (RQC) complex YloA/Tae2 family protein
MVKQRMTGLDTEAMCRDLESSIVGMRLQNVYNVTSKLYLFKFSGGGGKEQDGKKFVLMESGFRFHSTVYERSKPKIPSSFSVKLRKHLCNKRLAMTTATVVVVVGWCWWCSAVTTVMVSVG